MSNHKNNKSRVTDYVKYSGVAFQMFGLIIVGYFAGQYLDQRFSLEVPYFTAGLILLFVIGYLYKLIKELL